MAGRPFRNWRWWGLGSSAKLGIRAGGGLLDELAHVRLQRLDLGRRDKGAEDEVAFAAVLVALLGS